MDTDEISLSWLYRLVLPSFRRSGSAADAGEMRSANPGGVPRARKSRFQDCEIIERGRAYRDDGLARRQTAGLRKGSDAADMFGPPGVRGLGLSLRLEMGWASEWQMGCGSVLAAVLIIAGPI